MVVETVNALLHVLAHQPERCLRRRETRPTPHGLARPRGASPAPAITDDGATDVLRLHRLSESVSERGDVSRRAGKGRIRCNNTIRVIPVKLHSPFSTGNV